jgi:hypothetical protein
LINSSGFFQQKHAGQAQKDKEAHGIGDEGQHDAGADCGVLIEFVAQQRDAEADEDGDLQVDKHGDAHDQGKVLILIEQPDQPADQAA